MLRLNLQVKKMILFPIHCSLKRGKHHQYLLQLVRALCVCNLHYHLYNTVSSSSANIVEDLPPPTLKSKLYCWILLIFQYWIIFLS